MKKILYCLFAALFTIAACTEDPMPAPDQGDQEQTETPGEQPEEPGETPEEPGETPEQPDEPTTPEPTVPFEWPNDPTAFDYGVADKESRRAAYPLADREAAGLPGQGELSGPALIDGITYGGPGIWFYGNRMTINKVNAEWSEEYPDVIPTKHYVSFKINRPGSVNFYQSIASGITRIPTYFMAVVTTKNGVTSAKIVDSVIPADVTEARPGSPDASYSEENMKYHVTLTVAPEDLEGITEAATVYIYHRWTTGNTCQVHYYPLTWTVDGEGSMVGERKGKILLAGDSLVTEYGESSAPQTGWGQCLSAALGGGVQVSNHAVGGESTKSFLDNGKWKGLITSTLRGDVVLIQFMHNDQKTAETHATDPATTYKENLRKFISDVRERGATPVLVTSVLRRQFRNGNVVRNLGDYPAAMCAVAIETNTLLIDCEQWSYDWLTELGEEGSEPYYIVYKRGASSPDNTHFTREGAEIVAKFIADEMIRLGVWVK